MNLEGLTVVQDNAAFLSDCALLSSSYMRAPGL